jgi:hypothetical protein
MIPSGQIRAELGTNGPHKLGRKIATGADACRIMKVRIWGRLCRGDGGTSVPRNGQSCESRSVMNWPGHPPVCESGTCHHGAAGCGPAPRFAGRRVRCSIVPTRLPVDPEGVAHASCYWADPLSPHRHHAVDSCSWSDGLSSPATAETSGSRPPPGRVSRDARVAQCRSAAPGWWGLVAGLSLSAVPLDLYRDA